MAVTSIAVKIHIFRCQQHIPPIVPIDNERTLKANDKVDAITAYMLQVNM